MGSKNLSRGIITTEMDNLSGADAVGFVRDIESLGYDSFWIPELFGREPMATAGYLLAKTDRIKIAAPLNVAAWTQAHKVDPMVVPYGVVELAKKLRALEQHHFVGEKDKGVPPGTMNKFSALMSSADTSKLTEVAGFDHQCCWVRDWPELLRAAVR